MFLRQAITGMMQLFSVFAFFAIGFVCISLPFFEPLRLRLLHILLEETRLQICIGIGFVLLAFFLTAGFYGLSKGKFLLLRMGGLTTEVDIKLLKKAISPILSKHFPSLVFLTDLEICKNQQLRIGLSIAPMEAKEKEKTLLEAERQLQTLLSERFGYCRPFTVQLKT